MMKGAVMKTDIKIYSRHEFGDMLVIFITDDENHMGMLLIPSDLEDKLTGMSSDTRGKLENLVQLHSRGDHLANGYGNGITLAGTSATDALHFISQRTEGHKITTELADDTGRTVCHVLEWEEGLKAIRSYTVFVNKSDKPVILDLISSVNIGGLTPFSEGDAAGELTLHRIKSAWSAEGRLSSESIEEAMLERSWTGHALRIVKFGQAGSMPVRGYFPFAALEDRKNGVTWAMQLACPSSWQMEIRRKEDTLSMMASLADYDFGHWAKTIACGESFRTPEAYITAGCGGVDQVSQRLLTVHKKNMPRPDAELPVLFNEYCTTWGDPSHKNIKKIADTIEGHGFDFFVIDAGWYRKEGVAWDHCGGDWIANETSLFPDGIKATADVIRSRGMIPGIWFEPETCAEDSDIFKREDMLLRRDGAVIDTDNRRFLDMRKKEVRDYLNIRMISFLRDNGFGYTKIDYNDCIGIGCDDPDSPGEGLRQNMLQTLDFFRQVRNDVPGIWIENCSSGGHRLEPSFMSVADMASFSDAHECQEIPIIAAALHRLILPAQSQIWSVIRKDDSLRRIGYSLIATFLGVMCISGDVVDLTSDQWDKIDEGIAFYRDIRHIIRDGVSSFYGDVSSSWRHPEGHQAVCRSLNDETLTVIHSFGGDPPGRITLPVKGTRIIRVMRSGDDNEVSLSDGLLTVDISSQFDAVAIYTG